MGTLTVSIELKSPLLVGAPRQGNIYSSYSYLPGSVLRGAVAGVLIADWTHEQRQEPHPESCADPANCDFCRVLYPHDASGQPLRQPRFFDCYPAMAGSQTVQPLPHTARTCKRYPGFLRSDIAEERHGVFDTLIRQVAARDAARSAKPTPYLYTLTCPTCGEPLKSPDPGYFGRIEQDYYSARPRNRRFSRTAINRRRHTAQAGQLFTLSVMGEQMFTDLPGREVQQAATRLEGLVDTGDADVTALRRALVQVGWLGSGNSRGLGQVTVQANQPFPEGKSPVSLETFQEQVTAGNFRPVTNGADLGNRLAAFNQAITQERAFYRALGIDVLPGNWYFTLDLLADTFVTQHGLPALHLTPSLLGLKNVELDFVAVEPVERGGWSNAWGLPRPRELGIASGGVFLYRVTDPQAAVTAQLWQQLDTLENDGVGAQQARGSGRVQVCAPFHTEVMPQ